MRLNGVSPSKRKTSGHFFGNRSRAPALSEVEGSTLSEVEGPPEVLDRAEGARRQPHRAMTGLGLATNRSCASSGFHRPSTLAFRRAFCDIPRLPNIQARSDAHEN